MGNLISNYIDNILDIFYESNFGYLPPTNEYYETKATVAHLHDNGFKDYEISKILSEIGKMKVSQEDLPDYLWEHSILERDTFYYHNQLHIISEPSSLCMATLRIVHRPFFLEMKIMYSVTHIIDYFYRKLDVPIEMRNYKKDCGAVKKMLYDYNKFETMHGVDFILTLIDCAYNDKDHFNSYEIFNINNYKKEAFENLQYIINHARAEKTDVIKWRRGSEI